MKGLKRLLFGWILALLLAMLLPGNFACAASRSILEHPTVAVYPLENKGILSKEWNREEMGEVYTYVDMALADSGKFQVIERSPEGLRNMLDEYYLTNTGLLDTEHAAQAGKMLGAEYLVLGSVNGVTTRRSQTTIVGAGTKRAMVTAEIALRVVDAETGEIVLASIGRSRQQSTLTKAPLGLIRIGTDDVDKQQVLDALEGAADDAVDGLIARMEGRQKNVKR